MEQQTNDNACFMAAVHKEGLTEFRDKIKILVEKLYEKRYPHKTRFW